MGEIVKFRESAAIQGHHKQIKGMLRPQAAVMIQAEIVKICKKYGVSESIDKFVMEECIDVMFRFYGHLGLNEISEAFRLAANGEIKADLTFYNGVFHAGIFSKVMSKYSRYRREEVGGYLKKKEENEFSERLRVHKEKLEKEFNEKYMEFVERFFIMAGGYKDMPLFLFDVLKEQGDIAVDGIDIGKVETEAKLEAAKEAKEAKENIMMSSIGVIMKQNRLKDLDWDRDRWKVLARKMVVWKFCEEKFLNE